MVFGSNSTFTYTEKITKQGSTITLNLIKPNPVTGTYTYTGTPNVEGNLSFTFKK